MDTNKEIQLFCSNITWLRKKHGLTKKTMAAALGIGLYTLNKLEAGQLPPRLSCRIFDVVYCKFAVLPSVLVGCRLDQEP